MVAAVLTAAVMHASWNAITKNAADRTGLLVRMTIVSTALSVPLAVLAPVPARASWLWLGLSVILHVVYAITLVVAYGRGDFNQTYPIARGVGPVIVAFVAATVFGESLSGPAVAGVAFVAAGAVLIGISSLHHSRNLSGLGASLLTAVAIAGYTVVDGIAVRASGDAVGYAAWLIGLQGPLMVVGAWILRRSSGSSSPASSGHAQRWRDALAAGAMSGTAYGLVLWAQTRADLASVAALRETSIVFAAVIGAVLLGEPAGRARIVASCAIAGGGVVLALAG